MRKIGNSQGLILPKPILELIGAAQEDSVFQLTVYGSGFKLNLVTEDMKTDMIMKTSKRITKSQEKSQTSLLNNNELSWISLEFRLL